MTENIEEKYYCSNIQMLGENCTYSFNDAYSMALFNAALATVEYDYDILTKFLGVSMDSVFDASVIKGERQAMSLREAKDKGLHVFVFKDTASDMDIAQGVQAMTFLFYPERYKEKKMAPCWACGERKLFFTPAGEESDAFSNLISLEFDNAMYDILKIFKIKENQDGLIYLRRKHKISQFSAGYSEKYFLACVGLKIFGFNVDKSVNVLGNGDLMAMDTHDENLLMVMDRVYRKPSFKERLLVKKLERAKQNEM